MTLEQAGQKGQEIHELEPLGENPGPIGPVLEEYIVNYVDSLQEDEAKIAGHEKVIRIPGDTPADERVVSVDDIEKFESHSDGHFRIHLKEHTKEVALVVTFAAALALYGGIRHKHKK